MADRIVRVGILQIASHPAVVVGDVDLLSEPVLPRQPLESISLLARRQINVGPCLQGIRSRYLEWQRLRLEFLFRWLKDHHAPQVLALPECSVPFELLDVARNFAREANSVVLAGTHTLRRGNGAFDEYRNVGVREQQCKEILESEDAHASVLPIVQKKETFLHLKGAPSVFELTDLDANKSTPIAVRAIPVGSPKISVATLVCAEALRPLKHGNKKAELAFIVAREQQPQRFDPPVQSLIQASVPVALVNDAAFGGSFIRGSVDRRLLPWWFAPPLNGALPMGDFYLEVDVNVGNPAVQVDVAAPATTARLARVLPIFPDGAPEVETEHKLLEAASARDAVQIDALLRERCKSNVALQFSRWSYVATAIRNHTLTDELLDAVGQHIATTGSSSLDALEQDLAHSAQASLDKILNDTPGLPDEAYGQIYRATKTLRERSSRKTESPGGPVPTVLPIGRSTEIADIRTFATKGKQRICFVTGLEGEGKSAVVSAALAQAGTRNLRVTCVPGMSADTIFEYLVRSGDRIAAGHAPRSSFPDVELAEALRRFDVVWIENGHYLLEGPGWSTGALDVLMQAIVRAADDAGFRLIFESRRRLPLSLGPSVLYLSRQLGGLPQPDAIAFFESHLRRTGIELESVQQDTIVLVVKLVSGHPGLLALAAEAASRQGLPSVVDDLKARRGFFIAAIGRLVHELALTDDEKAVLQALSACRRPIPAQLLAAVSEGAPQLIARLADACVVERSPTNDVTLAPILSDTAGGFSALLPVTATKFHKEVSGWLATRAATAQPLVAFTAAIEANYHATLAGLPNPCKLVGIFDEILAVARRERDRDNYSRVIELLEPIVEHHGKAADVPENMLGMYAEALAWSGDFDRALEVADAVVAKNTNYAWLYTDTARAALHSHKLPEAQLALERAEVHAPESHMVSLLKGQLAERSGDSGRALAFFRDAEARAKHDGWPAFYLSRALIWRGEYEEALAVAGRGRDKAEKHAGRGALALENALMQQEMVALLFLGKHETAKVMLGILEGAPEPRPEVIVCAAYVRAYYSKATTEDEVLEEFDKALKRLDPKDFARSHTRAQVELFRGKLRELKGDLLTAKEDYRRAVQSDPENMHMRLCLLRAIRELRGRAMARRSAAGVAEYDAEMQQAAEGILQIDETRHEALDALEFLKQQSPQSTK